MRGNELLRPGTRPIPLVQPASSRSESAEAAHIAPLRAWIGVVVLWFFYVLSLMDRGVVGLMVGPIMQELNISFVQVGVLQGFAFATLYAVAALPLGWAVDNMARRRLLLAGVLVWSLGTLACGLSQSFTQILAARAFVGLGEAVLVPTALSLIADMFPRHRLGVATAVLSSGATVGAAAAFMVGGAVMGALKGAPPESLFGNLSAWRGTFLVFGFAGILVAWMAFLVPDLRPSRPLKENGAGHTASVQPRFAQFMRERALLFTYIFIAFPLLIGATIAFQSWAPRHFETAFHWPVQKVGFVLGMLKLIAAPLGVICGGLAMDKALRAGVAAPYFVVPMVTTLVGAPVLAIGLLQGEPGVALVLLASGLFIFTAYGSSHYVVLQVLAPPQFRGRLSALYVATSSFLSMGLGAILPPLVNHLATSSGDEFGRATAIAILGISVVVVVLLALGRRRLQAALVEAAGAHR